MVLSCQGQCGRGGIGRRAALRSLWGNTRGGSSPLDRTILSTREYVMSLMRYMMRLLGATTRDNSHVLTPRSRTPNAGRASRLQDFVVLKFEWADVSNGFDRAGGLAFGTAQKAWV